MTKYRTILIILSMALLEHNWRDTGKKNYQLCLYESQRNYFYPSHIHREQMEIVGCTRGRFIHRIGGKNILHKEGELRLIRERDIHQLRGDDFSYFNLSFSSRWLDRLAVLTGRDRNGLFSPGEGGLLTVKGGFWDNLEDRLERLFRWEDADRGAVPFSRFLLELVEMGLTREEDNGERAKGPDWLVRAVDVLDETLSLPAAIEAGCRSREHFIRTFKKSYAATPVSYLNRLRIEKASRLLIRTNLPMGTVALQCGYENQNYFNRRFREEKGITPGEFRKRYAHRVH